MATLRAQDRLQPALLDRLTDDDPQSRVETAEARVINRTRLRDLVLRDLGWLFNATRPTDARIDWASLPHASRSVINFGLPPLSGQSASSVDLPAMQDAVRAAIIEHEPRILPETLAVEAIVNEMQMDHHNQIGFRITGQMWAQPVPLELMLHTDIDLETGRVEIRETTR
jgi:type VI secretion system protein ImpF